MTAPITSPGSPRLAVNSTEAGEMLGVSRYTIGRLVREGRIATVPGLGSIRISVAELERYADSGRAVLS